MNLVNFHDLNHVGERPELQASCAEEEDGDRECDQNVHRVCEESADLIADFNLSESADATC